VSLAFTPTVLEGGRISMRVRPEVSELSTVGSIRISGFEIPALTTRRTETTVELGSGQSFMIGGLLRNSSSNSTEKAPWLGDLPILGALFRSNSFRRNETELVIVVTPYLVKPVSAGQIALPTDGFRTPNDAQRILLDQQHRSRSGEQRPGPVAAPPRTVAPGVGALGAANQPVPTAPARFARRSRRQSGRSRARPRRPGSASNDRVRSKGKPDNDEEQSHRRNAGLRHGCRSRFPRDRAAARRAECDLGLGQSAVVQRTDYVFDLAGGGSGVAGSELERLAAWFDTLGLGYGDRIMLDTGSYYDRRARRTLRRWPLIMVCSSARAFRSRPDGPAGHGPGGRQPLDCLRAGLPRLERGDGARQPHVFRQQLRLRGQLEPRGDDRRSERPRARPVPRGRANGDTASKAIKSYRDAVPTGTGGLKDTVTKGGK
jgi:hypothetical protein